jgi:hypothetical protein
MQSQGNGMSQVLRDDLKVIFDSLRNVGICAGFLLGASYVYNDSPLIFGSSYLTTAIIFGLVIFCLALYSMNAWWLFTSLKSKPKSKVTHVIGGMSLIAMATIATALIGIQKLAPFFGY